MPTFQYDVALSFAGEQRSYVEAVAEHLRDRGVNVFYDAFEAATLWGKNLYDHLDDVYRNKARFVVVFASTDYARKAWTNHERKSAQARALTEKGEYLLPARFDDTDIPGVVDTIGYVDLTKLTPEQIADLIVEKLGMAAPSSPLPPRGTGAASVAPSADDWASAHRPKAVAGLERVDKTDFFEVTAGVDPPVVVATQLELDRAVATSNIDTFGWPIGVHFSSGEHRPRPIANGIVAEVTWAERRSYDYWALATDGRFFLLKTLSEDQLGRPEAILFNTRIVRVAETLLFLRNLYATLGAGDKSVVTVTIRHTGLAARELSGSGSRRHTMHERHSIENESQSTVSFQLGDLDVRLADLVRNILDPLFVLFDYFQPEIEQYQQIISDFEKGNVT